MKILAFISKGSSPAYHRVVWPLVYMDNIDVFITNNLLEEHFEGVDVFMYNRIISEPHISEIYKLRQKLGFKICVDIDDYWVLEKTHPYYTEYETVNFIKLQLRQLREADFVFVTHDRLLRITEEYNKETYIIPNAIPQKDQFKPFEIKPQESGLCRIFWQGSNTHKEDLMLIAPAIASLVGRPGIEMVMAGHDESDKESNDTAKIYTACGDLKHWLIGALHIDAYYQVYREADLCLVPLKNTTFNRMKSNLKVLEAANLGLPCICHKVHPYMDLPVFYANGTKNWVDTIMKLVNNKSLRDESGQELKEFCAKKFDYEKINAERRMIFEHLSKK